MKKLDINSVAEISVTLNNGRDYLYKGEGLETLRRLMLKSPPLEIVKKPTVIETCLDSPEYEEYFDQATSRGDDVDVKPRKGKILTPQGQGAYGTADLNYAPVKGISAVNMAKEMQRQAEQASGIKF